MAIDNVARSKASNIEPEQFNTSNDPIAGDVVIYNSQGQLEWVSITGGIDYKGLWDADLNVPALVSGVGTTGDLYKVSVSGNTNLDGITNWEIDDEALFNGTVWQRIPATNVNNTPVEITGTQSINQLDTLYLVNATVADAIITIPDADANNGGRFVQIIKNSGDFNVIVKTVSNQIIGTEISQTIEQTGKGFNCVSRNSDSSWVINQDSRQNIENEIIVAKSGGQFTSVKEALDSITDNSPTQRYAILVSPGIYEENNPIQGKEYVSLRAVGDLQTTRLTALNASQDLITMTAFFTIEGFSLSNVTGANNYAVKQTVAGLTSLTRCVFFNCSNGALLNNINGSIDINDCAVLNSSATTAKGVQCLAGSMNLNTFTASSGDITTLLEISGINSIVTVNNIRSFINTLTTGVSIKDLANVDIFGAKLINMATGIELEGGASVSIDGIRIEDATIDGVRINDIGSNTKLTTQSTIVLNSANLDFNFLSPTGLVSGNASTSLNKVGFVDGFRMYGVVTDLEEDDEGINVLGELHVGLAEIGAESALGEGDSYTRGMLVYTESDIGAFVDVSANARSASASSFTFTDVTVDSAIYIASSLENSIDKLVHYGIKTKVITQAVIGAGNIDIEYWNGVSWVKVNGMEVGSDGGFYPHANNYFQDIGGYHIRYSQELAQDSWTKTDPMILGTDYFWVRLRITSAIITAPIFEQFKLHTSRFEVNSDGWIEYFGNGRPIGQLPLNLSTARPIEGNMQSQSIYVSENLGNGLTQNKFTAIGDILGVSGFLPFDADTSTPLKLQWAGLATNNQTIGWTVRWGYTTQGDSYFTSEPAVQPNAQITTISKAILLGQMEIFEVELQISDMVSRREGGFGDELWISIQPTTLSGTLSITSSQILYTKWSDGGHI